MGRKRETQVSRKSGNNREDFRRSLIGQGYTPKQAERKAREIYPTAREAALLKAQAARRAKAAERREASTQTLAERMNGGD